MIPINYGKVNQYTSSKSLIEKESPRFTKIIGKEIQNIWIVWELNDDKWYSDCPVVIEVNNQLLLINNYQECSIDIGWNTLSIDNKVYNFDYGYNSSLQWTNQYEKVNKFVGGRIEEIYCEEYLLEQTVMMSKSNHNSVGEKIQKWLFSGIGIMTDRGYLSIFNGLDENAFEFEFHKKSEKYRYLKLFESK